MKIHNVLQKTPEWYALRLQYPLTASKAQAIGNNGKGLETLCWEQMAQKYSSAEREQFSNVHLERGVELEPQARSIYELKTGKKVVEVGFVTNEEISAIGGASPDGLVDDDGLVEIKAFDDTKFFKMVVDFKKRGEFEIDPQYMWQMQMQMLFTGRRYVDFVAFNPNFKDSMLIITAIPDEKMQQKIIEGLKKGEQIIKDIEETLSK